MYLYQYALLAAYCCLLLNKETRLASIAFLGGWLVYLFAVIGLNEVNYYALSGAIELAIAYSLNNKYRAVAYLGYLLVVYNFIGFLAHHIDTDYPYFDIGYAVISITQLLFLLARLSPNGLNGLPAKHFVVRLVNFDSRGAYDRMYKNKTKKGPNR